MEAGMSIGGGWAHRQAEAAQREAVGRLGGVPPDVVGQQVGGSRPPVTALASALMDRLDGLAGHADHLVSRVTGVVSAPMGNQVASAPAVGHALSLAEMLTLALTRVDLLERRLSALNEAL